MTSASRTLNSRRALLASAPFVAFAPAAYAANAAAQQGTLLHVGAGRPYATPRAALDAITDADASRPYVVAVDPGVYDIAGEGVPLFMKPFVTLAGSGRGGTVLLTSDSNNIRLTSQCTLSELGIVHAGGTYAGALQSSQWSAEHILLSGLRIDVVGAGAAFVSDRNLSTCEIRDTTIVTASSGIAVLAGGRMYLHDVNIHLHGSGGDHYGIVGDRNCRIYVFGGKIGTGYGYGEVTDTSQSVIGVLTMPSFSGRVVMHGVWSICKNDGAPTGVDVNCIRVTGPGGWVRLFGGYYQAENPTGSGGRETLSNVGPGRIEVYGTRVRTYGDGPIYSTNQVGSSRYTTAHHGLGLAADDGGLICLDATAGPFTLHLPGMPSNTAQFIFKKVDTTANAITIEGGGRTIDGKPRVVLGKPYALRHMRYADGQYLLVA